MTPLRQALNAAVVAAGLAVAAPTFAQEVVEPIGPPTASDVAAKNTPVAPAPPVAVAPSGSAKPAAAKSPPWLANRAAPQAKVAGGQSALPSLGRLVGLFVVLGALGAAVIHFKRKGRVSGQVPAAAKRLSVVSSTRIGPKAHAVVISVAGRQMLLGVTDSSVKRLAFIDELTEEEEEEARRPARDRDPRRRAVDEARERGAGIGVRTVTPEPTKPGSFSDILKTAFGKRPPVQADAASILAAETHDTVGGKPVAPSPAPVRMLDVEGQAQGLIRRLGGPRT
jgi:flagellar biogenesis protein FliO